MVVVTVAEKFNQKQSKPNKLLKIIQPLEETEVEIHSKNLLNRINRFNGWTDGTKGAFFGFTLHSSVKEFFQWKFWEELVYFFRGFTKIIWKYFKKRF